MAILRQPAHERAAALRNWRALTGLLTLVCLAGCMLVDALDETERAFAFNHSQHGEEQGLACGDCHSGWENAEDPGMPRPSICALCHADLDADKPPERRIESLFEGDRFKAALAGLQSEEIVFGHQQHATLGIDCTVCHADVAQDEGALAQRGDSLRMSMGACIACHDASTGPGQSQCEACHAEIRVDLPPPTHSANWTRYHGTIVRSERSDQCVLCHQPSSCVECHHIELPLDHTNYWRRRAHGLTASMDRDRCITCHDSDSCQRCHEEIRPQSHVAGWGEPRDRHCLTCHEPVRSTTCGVCHPATPSHDLATPLPPDHSPAMDCRLCHGNGQPLPHVDNGQTCTSCHR